MNSSFKNDHLLKRGLEWIPAELDHLNDENLIRIRKSITPLPKGKCLLGGQELINMAGNDYLDLSTHPDIIASARKAAKEAGVGSRASALVIGRTSWHENLEKKLAEFEKEESALLFPTGYAANLGTITSLVQKNDIIFSDSLNHASLIDGCRLSSAKIQIYPHSDMDFLNEILAKSGQFDRRWIITDGLFSMDGDLAKLPEICELAEKYNAGVIVDEAHGTGILGANGRGACEELGVEEQVTVRVGTLSKGIGSLGGFVTGSNELCDWLWNRARSQIYSTALSPVLCAAAFTAIDIIEKEPERRIHLSKLSRYLQSELRKLEYDIPDQIDGPIIPVILHDPLEAVTAADKLKTEGILVAAIRPPTVPQGTSRLRISLSSAHTFSDIDRLIKALQ
jgi:8-amino-7-oxononanoate synthase